LRDFDWSNITRLLNSPENAIAVATVASSMIEALGGFELL